MKRTLFAMVWMAAAMVLLQCTPKVGDKTKGNAPAPNPSTAVVSGGDGLDRSVPPKAGAAPKIQIGKYETFKLANGVEVIVVKSDKLPRVSFQIDLDLDPMLEGNKAGLVDLTGQLLRTGTQKRTKVQIDEEIDFIGGTLSTTGRGIFGSSLTKHQEQLLELMADVLLNPTFPQEELEKLKKQTKSAIAAEKDEPESLANNVANVLNFSKKHPYGEIITEKTVESIQREDCEQYYKAYFKPNVARLVVVGDVDAAALKGQLEKHFGTWKAGNVPTHTYPMPAIPQAAEVAFVHKDGAVQSVINVTYPTFLKPGAKDAIAVSVMNTILGGGGFSGYLMQNLREDKAYTYGARSTISPDELVTSFKAFASVRNEVTDSAVTEFLYEMNRICNEKVNADHLRRTLNQMTGSFARSLEQPQTVANFALNIARYNLPADYYETYLEKLNAITADDIQRVAKQYIRPDNAYILVVGNRYDVADKLKRFAADGNIKFFDTNGEPMKISTNAISGDMTAEKVLAGYMEAIGGKAWEKVEDMKVEADIEMGQMVLKAQQWRKTPNMLKMEISMAGNAVQSLKYDGKTGSSLNPMTGQAMPMEGEELDEAARQAIFNIEGKYAELGYGLELKGIEQVDGKDAYKIIATAKDGTQTTEFYEVTTGLKLKEISARKTPQGNINVTSVFGNYKAFDNIKMATEITQSMGPQSFKMVIKDVKINSGLADSVFK